MTSVSSESLINKLISSLKTDNLWIEFMECIGAELDTMRGVISTKKDFYNINKQLEDGLIRIAKTYGYTPNLIVDNSLQMIRKEVESIPYRIRYKTTYRGYYIIFKQIGKMGDIYNYYWSGKKLIKAVRWNDIIECLTTMKSYSEPFLCVSPDKNFSTISTSDSIQLDNNLFLDTPRGQWNWRLDENIEISPTKHLGIEYYPQYLGDLSDNKDLLVQKNYFQYLSVGVDYNKRLPIVPHCGVQLTGINYEGGGSNYFNPNDEYTIPKLKLNSVLGFDYNKFFVLLDDFRLDNKIHMDEIVPWTLDKGIDTSLRPPLSEFTYISCGNGTLSELTSKEIALFNYSNLIMFYTFDGEDSSYEIIDHSLNGYNASIVGLDPFKGQTKRVHGIIGKTVDFNGITSVETDKPISIIPVDLSFGFWFSPTSKDYFDHEIFQCIVSFEFLSFSYSYKKRLAYYSFGDSIEGFVPIEPDSINNVIFEVNTTTKKLQLYINAELLREHDISNVSYEGKYKLYIGSDPIYHDNFSGIIDSMWMINKLYTVDELKEIYLKKLSILTSLDNRMATYQLQPQHEGFENDKWRIIQSHVKANDVTNEFGFFAESSLQKEDELVNVFYDGRSIKYEMLDDPLSSDKYSNFGKPLMQVYFLKTLDTEYLYSTDTGEEKTYYHQFTYDAETDSVVLFDPYMIHRGHIEPTDYQYYSKVTYTKTRLINTTYKGKTNFFPIKKEYFFLNYKTYEDNGIDIRDVYLRVSSDGKLYNKETNKEITGYLNAETGEYEVSSLTEGYTNQESPTNSLDLPHFACVLKGSPTYIDVLNTSEIKKGTLTVNYRINDNVYLARDDGEGGLIGTGLYNGRINYTTREVFFSFEEDSIGTDITMNYTYLESLNMVEDSAVTFDYKVENEPITEIGLEDKEHNLLAYMTFPPVQFDTINNHISAMFVIRKR